MSDFSHRLVTLRKQQRIPQRALAPLLGMTQPELGAMESGARRPTKKHVATLAAVEILARHGLLDDLRAHINAS